VCVIAGAGVVSGTTLGVTDGGGVVNTLVNRSRSEDDAPNGRFGPFEVVVFDKGI
jgi:hypothetical protein